MNLGYIKHHEKSDNYITVIILKQYNHTSLHSLHYLQEHSSYLIMSQPNRWTINSFVIYASQFTPHYLNTVNTFS